MPPQQFDRGDKNGIRFELKGGTNTISQSDLVPAGQYKFLANVRRFLGDRITGRAPQTDPVATMGSGPVHSLRRLNDSTPAGPVSGFTLIGGSGTSLYSNSTAVATGLSGNPISLVPFRPNTSVQPWEYVGDSSLTVNIPAPVSFNCAGMLKVRSDGLTRKDGVAEPQAAPTVTFPGGGSGPSQIFYYYVYRASETGALSNPSPVSVPGTNSQSNPSESQVAATGGVINPNITVNGTQYEGNGSQIRTTGSVAPNTTTDYIIARDFGFAIPSGVTIDGIQVDLNWLGQNSGTGALTGVALYYLGGQLGNAKSPGIQNQSFSTDTLQGGSGDTWNATLTPDIINDSTFGFGVQITTATVGGSDRSFVNSMAITVFYSTQNANITPTASTDPQVDKIDIYRQGGGLADPTYVGTNPNTATVFNDTLSDLAAATNPLLQFDNFEPFPSIDLPRSGVINVTSNVLTYVSGDHFNLRWLPGTIMLIGSPTQLAFSAVRRPTSTTSWDFTNNDPTVTPIADGTNLAWNIAEPILAAQSLPSLWGPTDNTAYMFGCFDPLRPGTLYYTKGNNPDSAPDTNQIEVTSPSEPLMNGVIVNGLGMVFSTERAWLIYPTFTTALATVTGIEGQAFNLIESITDRGLYIRSAICTEAGKRVFFRGKDGIYVSVGGSGSQSITDATIYNLFPHEGELPIAITIAGQVISPPDDSLPESQKLRFATGYLYYDYIGLDSNPHTLVYDVAAGGWIIDTYQHPVTIHALEEGPNVNGVLVGCADGTVRNLASGGTETGTQSYVATGSNTFGDARAFQRIGDVFVKAFIAVGHPVALSIYTDQYQTLQSGFSPTSLTGVSTLAPYIVDFTSGGGLDANDIATVYSWDTNSANYLDLWQPDIIQLPETTQARPTDWDDAGGPGNKFFIGGLLEADTFGQPKAFAIEDELNVLHIPNESPMTFDGQSVKPFTFTPPFTAHLVRIVSVGNGGPVEADFEFSFSITFVGGSHWNLSGAVAGDLTCIFVMNDGVLTTPAGWTVIAQSTGATGNGTVLSKVIDSGDISGGFDLIRTGGTQTIACGFACVGQAGGIRSTTFITGTTGAQVVDTPSDSVTGDLVFYFGGCYSPSTTVPTVTITEGVAPVSSAGLHFALAGNWDNLLTDGSQPIHFTTTGAPLDDFFSCIVVIASTLPGVDEVPWRVWPTGDGTAQWVAKPYPEMATVWNTEATTNNLHGYQNIYQLNLAYIATAPVTFTITTDCGNFSMTFPATSTVALQPAKILQKMPRNKFKVTSYSLSSDEPFYLWRDLTELWIRQWDSQDAMLKITPFGNATGSGAEV